MKLFTPLLFVALSLLLLSCGETIMENELDAVEPPRGAYLGQTPPDAHPEAFGPNIINGNLVDRDFTMSKDRRTMAYTLTNSEYDLCSILFLHRRAQNWTKPEVISFSGRYSDMGPMFDPNGEYIYFTSLRPTDTTDLADNWNLWRAFEAENNYWYEPVLIDVFDDSTSTWNCFSPTLSAQGSLFYTAKKEGGDLDIYHSFGAGDGFGLAENLGPLINSESDEYDVFVANDESYLIFSSNRGEAGESLNLYISYQEDGIWGAPIKLGNMVNSDKPDYAPFVSSDGEYLFFSSDRTDAQWQSPYEARNRRQILNMFTNMYNGNSNVFWIPLANIHDDFGSYTPPNADTLVSSLNSMVDSILEAQETP